MADRTGLLSGVRRSVIAGYRFGSYFERAQIAAVEQGRLDALREISRQETIARTQAAREWDRKVRTATIFDGPHDECREHSFHQHIDGRLNYVPRDR